MITWVIFVCLEQFNNCQSLGSIRRNRLVVASHQVVTRVQEGRAQVKRPDPLAAEVRRLLNCSLMTFWDVFALLVVLFVSSIHRIEANSTHWLGLASTRRSSKCPQRSSEDGPQNSTPTPKHFELWSPLLLFSPISYTQFSWGRRVAKWIF